MRWRFELSASVSLLKGKICLPSKILHVSYGGSGRSVRQVVDGRDVSHRRDAAHVEHWFPLDEATLGALAKEQRWPLHILSRTVHLLIFL